jgi:hypothetical protein
MRIGKRRRVLQGGSNSSYAYWVDIYIEIDYELCNDNAELALCNAGTIGPNTINYGTLFLFDNIQSFEICCFVIFHQLIRYINPTYHSEQTTISECIVCGSEYHL